MIFLDVKNYCQNNCNQFEADVEKTQEESYLGLKTIKGKHTTIVRCKHRDICERMRIQFSHPSKE